MKIIADTHTHSIACDHAYSTIADNAKAAFQRGLRFLAVTEHAPSMKGAPSEIHFRGLKKIPRLFHGVTILRGAEVNIMNCEGALDLPEPLLADLEWIIASCHVNQLTPGSKKENTRAWLAVAGNPHVDVIGHCGDGRYPFEWGTVLKEFAAAGKIVEINDQSLLVRPGSRENCPGIAALCAELGVRVVVNSDAHICTDVGRVDGALAMLGEIGFPEELVINADARRFLQVAREKSGKPLTDEIEE